MCALLICLPVVVVVFLPETEEVKRRKGLTCPFFTDVPVTINLSSGLNRHEVLRNKKKKWILQNPLSLLIREVYYISSSTERNLQMTVESEAALQWFFFSSPHFVIGLVNSCHTLEQPEAKQKKNRLVYKRFPAFEVARAVTDAL